MTTQRAGHSRSYANPLCGEGRKEPRYQTKIATIAAELFRKGGPGGNRSLQYAGKGPRLCPVTGPSSWMEGIISKLRGLDGTARTFAVQLTPANVIVRLEFQRRADEPVVRHHVGAREQVAEAHHLNNPFAALSSRPCGLHTARRESLSARLSTQHLVRPARLST